MKRVLFLLGVCLGVIGTIAGVALMAAGSEKGVSVVFVSVAGLVLAAAGLMGAQQ